MVGLVGVLVGEIAYEAVRFIIMLALLVLAVFVGGKLRKAADAKKAAKMAASENKNPGSQQILSDWAPAATSTF